MRRLNLNPNELVFGSEVRPQPPHCDKNSYILNHLLSSVTRIIKYKGKSVKWFLLFDKLQFVARNKKRGVVLYRR